MQLLVQVQEVYKQMKKRRGFFQQTRYITYIWNMEVYK